MTKSLHLGVLFLLFLSTAALAGGGHDHGADAHAVDAATPIVSHSTWTGEMELYLEYPAFVAGAPRRFTIYLTTLSDFQPIRTGSVTLRFRGPNGSEQKFKMGKLLREGVFAPTISLNDAGDYDFELRYESSIGEHVFQIPDFVVHPSAARAEAAMTGTAAEGITFLKAQQWKVPFATAPIAIRELKGSVRAMGEVLPAPRKYAEIVAPLDGVIQTGNVDEFALPGTSVRRGEILVTISTPLKGESWTAARLALEQAERDFDRARRLREKDAISEHDYEVARNAFLSSKAGHLGADAGPEDGLNLTAPIDGKIVDWQVRPGQRVQAGDKLMAVVDPSTVWLQVNVYENDFAKLGTPVGAYVDGSAAKGGWEIPTADMRLLSMGGALANDTRTVPVLLEVANPEGRLRINATMPVELHTSHGEAKVTVPRTAVFEDDGLYVVYVQTSGESFQKRNVTPGPRHGDWLGILAGLTPGERVVTQGGYHLKLASTSAEIGHGHAH